MSNTAALVQTHNSQSSIVGCLSQLTKYLDTMVVVDNGSTDQTVDFAKKYTDKVLVKPLDYQIEALLDSHEWVLEANSDERFTPVFLARIDSILKEYPAATSFKFPRIKYPNNEGFPDYQIRLTKRHVSLGNSVILDKYPIVKLAGQSRLSRNTRKGKVLICSLVRDAALWLDKFLGYITSFTYPEYNLTYAIVEGNSQDDSWQILSDWQTKYCSKYDIRIEKKDLVEPERFVILAFLRNYLIDNYLTDEEYILFIDSDIVNGPQNLVQLLINSKPDILAPLTMIDTHPSRDWLYDRLACRDSDGTNFKHEYPYFSTFDPYQICDVNSVGTIYIVKAEVYRRGIRYSIDLEHGEQIRFCNRARAEGFRVQINPLVHVFHVNFEDYNLPWH